MTALIGRLARATRALLDPRLGMLSFKRLNV